MELPYLASALEGFRRDESHDLPIVTAIPSANPNPNPSSDPNLRPLSSTAFKREARKKRRERKRQRKLEEKLEGELESLLALDTRCRPSDPPTVSNIEWPCSETGPDPNPEPAVWAVPNPNPNPPAVQPPADDDQVRVSWLQAQQNVLKQCQDFFTANDGSDDEDDEGESENFKFFLGLFEQDGDLRGIYEKNWEKGEFCCLVCGAIGEKIGKRYGNCVGLVQHANTVSKTKRREAHRDFGRAVCKVLGWDIAKLPGIFDGQSLPTDRDPRKEDCGLAEPEEGALLDYMDADSETD